MVFVVTAVCLNKCCLTLGIVPVSDVIYSWEYIAKLTGNKIDTCSIQIRFSTLLSRIFFEAGG